MYKEALELLYKYGKYVSNQEDLLEQTKNKIKSIQIQEYFYEEKPGMYRYKNNIILLYEFDLTFAYKNNNIQMIMSRDAIIEADKFIIKNTNRILLKNDIIKKPKLEYTIIEPTDSSPIQWIHTNVNGACKAAYLIYGVKDKGKIYTDEIISKIPDLKIDLK